jgi:hypothetical protein
MWICFCLDRTRKMVWVDRQGLLPRLNYAFLSSLPNRTRCCKCDAAARDVQTSLQLPLPRARARGARAPGAGNLRIGPRTGRKLSGTSRLLPMSSKLHFLHASFWESKRGAERTSSANSLIASVAASSGTAPRNCGGLRAQPSAVPNSSKQFQTVPKKVSNIFE